MLLMDGRKKDDELSSTKVFHFLLLVLVSQKTFVCRQGDSNMSPEIFKVSRALFSLSLLPHCLIVYMRMFFSSCLYVQLSVSVSLPALKQ